MRKKKSTRNKTFSFPFWIYEFWMLESSILKQISRNKTIYDDDGNKITRIWFSRLFFFSRFLFLLFFTLKTFNRWKKNFTVINELADTFCNFLFLTFYMREYLQDKRINKIIIIIIINVQIIGINKKKWKGFKCS